MVKEFKTGDCAELRTCLSAFVWRHIDARSETCLGQKCTDFDAASDTHARGALMRTSSGHPICFRRPGMRTVVRQRAANYRVISMKRI